MHVICHSRAALTERSVRAACGIDAGVSLHLCIEFRADNHCIGCEPEPDEQDNHGRERAVNRIIISKSGDKFGKAK